jgi:DNA-binding transcriptional regulator YiaG
MTRLKFNTLAKRTMKPASIARARKRAGREIAAMELAELRNSLKVTQTALARRMKVSQAAVSKLEKRSRNIHVNQLRALISALGGELHIAAVFPKKTVRLTHLGR